MADQPASEPLLPWIDELTRPFWEGCRRGELRLQRCHDTGRLLFPPREVSPFGARRQPEWVTVPGTGTIWSFVVPHPPLLPWFAERAPYNVILVALDADPGVRLAGNLLAREGGALGEVDPGTIEIGAPVRAVFEAITDEVTLPRWVRA